MAPRRLRACEGTTARQGSRIRALLVAHDDEGLAAQPPQVPTLTARQVPDGDRPVIDGVVDDEVYNDRRDTSAFTPSELLGRSFVVRYTRSFDY